MVVKSNSVDLTPLFHLYLEKLNLNFEVKIKEVSNMKIFILFVSILISMKLMANEKNCYTLNSYGLLINIDEFKNEIIIHKLVIDLDLIGGTTPYSLATPYKIPILSKKVSTEGWITFSGSTVSQNKGITVDLEIVNSMRGVLAYTVFKIIDKETGFSYRPSLIEVTKSKQTCLEVK